jgi:hypothetical protein
VTAGLAELARWLPWLAAWSGAGFVGGVLVAWRRNRWILGPLLGLLLGPLGWLLVLRMAARLRECPACSRPIAIGASTCRHCGADVVRAQARSARSSVRAIDRGGGW